MNYNLVTNIENCYYDISDLIYYSHYPVSIVFLLIGIFVFVKSKNKISGAALFFIAIIFSLWSYFDLIVWIDPNSSKVMFFWSMLNLLDPLIFAGFLYFVYIFIKERDASLIAKLLAFAILLPLILFISTTTNLSKFDADICEAVEGSLIYYMYFVDIIFSLWILIFIAKSYIQNKEQSVRQKIKFLSIGVILFLIVYLSINISSNITGNWKFGQFSLLSMPIFIGFLAYLIVKFKAFDIKLIGAQALVLAFIALIGSELFFAESVTNKILILVTLAIAIGFGYFLIKSVKNEVKRKEELQMMSDQLAKANDQLRKLDNAKSDFISIASHQLRTPLTSIKGFISLLSEGSYGKVTALQQETLNKVYQSNERLIHLVEDLLDISRIESGRMEFDFAPCQVADLCQEVVDGFVIRAKNNKLYLDYKKPAVALPEIMIDAGKIREVISNMVDNALKYTPRGGINLKIELAESSNYKPPVINNGQDLNGYGSKIEGQVLRVTVSDTGIGIPVTELPYLFSKFSRGKDIGRLNAAGTGLGLYVGRSMIEANGGHIWAESDGEGKGSRFIIELPVKQSEEILAKWGK